MKIILSPMRMDAELTLIKEGDTLSINGYVFDFSTLADGDSISVLDIPYGWITNDIKRVDGIVEVTVLFPHGPNPPDHIAYPEPIIVTEDGPIKLPGEDDG